METMQYHTSTIGKMLMAALTLCLAPCFISDAAAGSSNERPYIAISAPYNQDLAVFKRLRSNLLQLADDIKQRPDLFGPKAADDLTLLRPEMREQILAIWYPILDNYMTLDAMADAYSGFNRYKNKKDRKQAFHLARGIFLAQYRIALDIMPVLDQNPVVDTILNEATPPLGLPQGVYNQFKNRYLNVVKASRYAGLEAVARAYKASQDPQLTQMAKEDSRIILAAGKGPGPRMTLKNGLEMINRAGQATWFPAQKGVAEWMGHTKVWRRHRYLIQPEQITTLSEKLMPGDILMERREWYLTNVGIPGFWTHAALYIGDAAQREALSNHPDVKTWLKGQGADSIDSLIKKRYPEASTGMQTRCKDGLLPQVIESISPGVSFTSLNYSATCDSLAVLRPRLSPADRAAAVVRAMRYYGRPYDYAFDFGSDKSLVCTELIVKAYLPGEAKQGLALPLERLMGRLITPANAFVRQYDETFGTPAQQMDLVLFLDGNEKERRAHLSNENVFRKSWNRPKWHILVQYTQTDKPQP